MANKTSTRADQKTSTKIYTVVKDGLELDQLKTLAAAKKLADTEGAEVFCDGQCVYPAAVNPGAVNAAAVNPAAVNPGTESGMEVDEPLGETTVDGASTGGASTDEAAMDTPVDAQPEQPGAGGGEGHRNTPGTSPVSPEIPDERQGPPVLDRTYSGYKARGHGGERSVR